jgi:hypothetical protein
MRKSLIVVAATLPLLAGGCLHTVGTIVTAPVKATSKVVDWSTTSQSEADRNRGREMRREEEREAKERRKADEQCRKHPGDCHPDQPER